MSETSTKRGRGRTRKQPPPIRALVRGLQVLEILGNGRKAALSDVARTANLSCSTTFRVLETLRQRGYVEQDGADGLYRIGFKAVQIGASYSATSPLPQAAHAVMLELVEHLNETVNLAILDGNEAVYIHQVEAQRSIRMFTQLGARAPLHCTGVGKALVAWRHPEQLARLLENHTFETFTPTTLSSEKQLLAGLQEVRQRGYAIDDEEREVGVRCVTAPVRDAQGEVVAALSVSAPIMRFTKKRIAACCGNIVEAANKISGQLGYHPPSAT